MRRRRSWQRARRRSVAIGPTVPLATRVTIPPAEGSASGPVALGTVVGARRIDAARPCEGLVIRARAPRSGQVRERLASSPRVEGWLPIRSRCGACGRSAPPVIHWPIGPVCRRCYIRVRAHPAPCAGCGNTRALIAVDDESHGTCGPCAGSDIDYLCRRCGGGEERFRDGLCVRCVAIERLHQLFSGTDGSIPVFLQPLVDLLAQVDRPRSVIEWLRRDNGGAQVLRELAAAGVEPTHEALDAIVPAAVRSARGALPVFPPVGFPEPPPAPAVPVSGQRALHKSRCGSWSAQRCSLA